MLTVYTYGPCSTCTKATAWLRARGIPFEERPIRQTPPTPVELGAMLQSRGSLRPLFNTSSQDYRDLGIKDTLDTLPPADAFALMAKNGNLVKRPFALDPAAGIFLTGFKETEWDKAFPTT